MTAPISQTLAGSAKQVITVTADSGVSVKPSQFNEGFFTRNFYHWADKLFSAPGNIDSFTKSKLYQAANENESLGILQKLNNGFYRTLGWIGKKLTDYDYKEFPSVLGKFKVSEPPIGALILLLYPFTVGPRLYRAAKRDSREVGDVLRRDLTAITIFLFALKPIINFMNSIKGKIDGLHLVDPSKVEGQSGKVFTYERLAKNLYIENPEILKALFKTDNGKALLNAAKNLHDGGLSKFGETRLNETIVAFNQKLNQLSQGIANNLPGMDEVAKEAFGHLEQMDVLRNEAIAAVKKGGSSEVVGMMGKLPEFKAFFARFAKTRRLPIDVISFLAVCVGIGWFPVWFNDQWNRKQFEEKMAAKRAQESLNFDRASAYEFFKQSSKLSQNFIERVNANSESPLAFNYEPFRSNQ
ncbi:MAG: hypothetical protein K2X66_13255 [Cyanobacteria bacterium]|nr:hypothetical protein [Cyanobacteriota bacterium]